MSVCFPHSPPHSPERGRRPMEFSCARRRKRRRVMRRCSEALSRTKQPHAGASRLRDGPISGFEQCSPARFGSFPLLEKVRAGLESLSTTGGQHTIYFGPHVRKEDPLNLSI